jgi:hypothetical protein
LHLGVIVSQEDPRQTVQAFIDLIQRHEQSFYYFVHKVHSKGENLFDGLMRWIELFLTVVREGFGSLVSLEFLLPHMGKERDEIVAEVDKVTRYHYALKVAYEAKIRRRFKRLEQNPDVADAEDEATQVLVDGVVGEIDFGELMHGDAGDLAAEEDETDSSDSDSEIEDSEESTDDSDDSTSLEGNHTPSRVAVSQSSPGTRASSRPLTPRRSMSALSSDKISSRLDQDLPPLPPLPHNIDTPTAARPSQYPPQASRQPKQMQKAASVSLKSPTQLLAQEMQAGAQSEHGHQATTSNGKSSSSKGKKKGVHVPKPPDLQHIPKLLPVFVEMVSI